MPPRGTSVWTHTNTLLTYTQMGLWITEKVPLDDYVMELCLLSLQNHQMDSRNPEF